jgi:uncharacterized membrane protein
VAIATHDHRARRGVRGLLIDGDRRDVERERRARRARRAARRVVAQSGGAVVDYTIDVATIA